MRAKSASALRAFRAVYLAIPINCMIIGWVNLAMAKIPGLTPGIPALPAVGLCLLSPRSTSPSPGCGRARHGPAPVRGEARNDDRPRRLRRRRRGRYGDRPGGAAEGEARVRPGSPLGVDAGAHVCGLRRRSGGGVVSGARSRAAADTSRSASSRRRPSATGSRDALVQRRPLQHPVVAVIPPRSPRPCSYGPMDDPETGYVRVMIDHLPVSLRGLMMAGFPGRVHVDRGDAPELGRLVLRGDIYKRFFARTRATRTTSGSRGSRRWPRSSSRER